MQKEIRDKWTAALRSGQYRQCSEALCKFARSEDEYGEEVVDEDSAKFCCLGVLGDILGVDRHELAKHSTLSDIKRDDLLGPWGENFESSVPASWSTVQQQLAGKNDNDVKFPEIADWIEANVPVEA